MATPSTAKAVKGSLAWQGAIAMSFDYRVDLKDPNNIGGTADGILVHDLEAALNQWSHYIDGIGTLFVELRIEDTQMNRAAGGATGSIYAGTNNGVTLYEPSSLYELTTGQHVPGTASDLSVFVDPDYFQYLDLARPHEYGETFFNKFNPVDIFLHEIGHGLGIAGWYNQDGSHPSNYQSTFDQYVVTINGTPHFVGSATVDVFGGPVPVTYHSDAGQNFYHFGDTQSDFYLNPSTVADPLSLDLMNGIVFFYSYSYSISDLDLAVMKDLGYGITINSDHPAFPFSADADMIAALYVGYYGRAGDPDGVSYWTGRLEDGMPWAEIAASYSVQQESTALYSFLAHPKSTTAGEIATFITSVYEGLFNRAPDTGGLNYWQAYLSANLNSPEAVGAFILDVINGAQNSSAGSDQTTISNKVHVSEYLATRFSSAGLAFDASKSAESILAHEVVASTGSSSASIRSGEDAIDDFVASHTTLASIPIVGSMESFHGFS